MPADTALPSDAPTRRPIVTGLSVEDERVRACLEDGRPEALELFEGLSDAQRETLVTDAWTIGLRALTNAYSQAREARLADVGQSLLQDMDRQLRDQLSLQERTLTRALGRFFDPQDGEVARRLEAFVADEGVLDRFLRDYLGSEHSVLAETLARQVGEKSALLRRLDPAEKDGVVQILEERVKIALEDNQRKLARALDPMTEGGAVARLLRKLREDLETADADRTVQLKKAIAALDANDETSLISRLMRETRDARATVLAALNPDDPSSPLAAIKTTVATMLEAHGKSHKQAIEDQQTRQRELEGFIRESVARLETRREAEASSPRGGTTFEQAVIDFIEAATRGAGYVVEATGTTTGAVAGRKVGDAIVHFTDESAFAGSRVVVEAKHDGSYTIAKALQEMEVAKENRRASVGIFVLSASHAAPGFPELARYGSTLLVTWDAERSDSDPILRGALLAGLFMAARRHSAVDQGDINALRDVEKRIESELARFGKIRKANDKIASSSEEIREELRKSERKLGTLLDKARATLRALNVELVDEDQEVASPVSLGTAVHIAAE